MHDVARSLWTAGRPVRDPGREEALVREMEDRGRALGLAPAFTRAFFTAQIEAARKVQEADFARWRAEGQKPFADAPDLAVLRQRIDGLNRELLQAVAQARPQLDEVETRDRVRAWAGAILTGEGITDAVRAAAVEPLLRGPTAGAALKPTGRGDLRTGV
jgi:chorismate mutase